MAATNKCLAESNKSKTGGNATKKCAIRLRGPLAAVSCRSSARSRSSATLEIDTLWLKERSVAGKDKVTSTTLLSDQRGAVAFEMLIVWLFLMMSLLLPLADVAIAGFQFVSAWGALRAFGQYMQYNPPPDVTNTSGWTSTYPLRLMHGYPISNVQVVCGDACCLLSRQRASPKYYSYTTTVTLSPMVLRAVLCTSSNANPCSFTLPYSERFQ